jgi:hypothetical protein
MSISSTLQLSVRQLTQIALSSNDYIIAIIILNLFRMKICQNILVLLEEY